MKINNEKSLIEFVKSLSILDAVVVEGYDGVGKGRVLSRLSEELKVTPYRPDYNLWQAHDHRHSDRWKISGFFWDVYSHFMKPNREKSPEDRFLMLFDRGVISGAVYNHDWTIAVHYEKMIRDMNILHILVCCEKSDYAEFQRIRNPEISSEEIDYLYGKYQEYTADYMKCLELSELPYIIYYNKYSKESAESLSETCAGCGHYSYGHCSHPDINREVDGTSPRCSYSLDKEIQDREVVDNVNEVQRLCFTRM